MRKLNQKAPKRAAWGVAVLLLLGPLSVVGLVGLAPAALADDVGAPLRELPGELAAQPTDFGQNMQPLTDVTATANESLFIGEEIPVDEQTGLIQPASDTRVLDVVKEMPPVATAVNGESVANPVPGEAELSPPGAPLKCYDLDSMFLPDENEIPCGPGEELPPTNWDCQLLPHGAYLPCLAGIKPM
jgi:hypothetical protein